MSEVLSADAPGNEKGRDGGGLRICRQCGASYLPPALPPAPPSCLCRRQHSPRPSRSRSCQKFRSLVSIRSRPWLDAIDPAVPKRLEDWLAARELPTIKTAVVEAALGQFLDRQPAPPQAPPPRRR